MLGSIASCENAAKFDELIHNALGMDRPEEEEERDEREESRRQRTKDDMSTGLKWTWTRSDGLELPLLETSKPSGGVSFSERMTYVKLYEAACLQESRMQSEALGRGLQRMVSSIFLLSFSFELFEEMYRTSHVLLLSSVVFSSLFLSLSLSFSLFLSLSLSFYRFHLNSCACSPHPSSNE